MKRLILLLSLAPLFASAQTVVFWTEDFGTGCNTGQHADNYFSINTGVWTVTSTGYNADAANVWFISAEEAGNDVGECGSACGGTNDRSLHLGSEGDVGTDLGAAYYEGFEDFCGLFPCGSTDKRVESPVINCSGMGNIVLDFAYIEGGNSIDNATLWYFDGSSWSQLADPAKTGQTCAPQGVWTAYSIALPASSNNNTNVKIGFRWINNDDLDATDPSFAVDDITLTGDFGEDLVPPTVMCPPDETLFTEEFCFIMGDYADVAIIFDDVDPFPQITQMPETGTELLPGLHEVIITATDNSGNSNFCTFMIEVIDDDAPTLTCPVDISVTAPPNSTDMFVSVPLPDVADNCTLNFYTNDFTNAEDASGTYPVGTTTVTYTAFDAGGNTETCSFDVTVTPSDQDCCLGDFNCDGFISVADLLYLIPEFGCVSGCVTDLDGTGTVTVMDLQIFNGLYGTVCP